MVDLWINVKLPIPIISETASQIVKMLCTALIEVINVISIRFIV